MMLQAGYACYKLSKKLFGFWWNTLVRHKRMCGVDSDFLENVLAHPRRDKSSNSNSDVIAVGWSVVFA
jgi:hypothetical protein